MEEIGGRYERRAEPFGAWLLRQDQRTGLVGDLARQAKADRAFPKAGSIESVRERMKALQADGDVWAALDDAELDYSAY